MVRRLPPEISSKKRPLRPHTTASCFATYLVPHVLFVESFEERRKIAKACCLAWNIALFPDADERERRLEAALDVITRDGDAPPGFRAGFADELRMLAEAKRDLFPWQIANVFEAELAPGPRAGLDVLRVEADGKVETTELAFNPSVMGAPVITRYLVQIHKDTKAQRGTLEEARATPGLLERVVGRDMLAAYCAQRADLRGYHRMLTKWQQEAAEPELWAGIERFLEAAREIEADTVAVVDVLAGALGSTWKRP